MKVVLERSQFAHDLSRVRLETSDEVVLERSQFAHDLSRVRLLTSDESGPGEESVCP